MQVFRELYIHGDPAQLAATTAAIAASLSGDWSRDPDTESRLKWPGTNRRIGCFRCKQRGRRPGGTLFLVDHGPGTDYVANIVPDDAPELTQGEYNSIIEEFFTRLVVPATGTTGARAELTEPEADLERWLSSDAARRLRLFCSAANKRTGSGHPSDRKLWNDFILTAHRDGTDLTAGTLARWLNESGGWSEEWAGKLAGQYAYARDLLSQASAQAVGV